MNQPGRKATRVNRRDVLKLLSVVPLSLALGDVQHSRVQSRSAQEAPSKPNVLILVLDALCARHTSLHGYRRATTPNLARFAERATVYHRHYAAANFTTPGTAALLTGTYPWSHRAFQLDGQVTPEYRDRNLFRLFGPAYHRIAYAHNTLTHLLLHPYRNEIETYLSPEAYGLAGGTLPSGILPDSEIAFRSVEKLLFRDWSLPGSLFFALADRLRFLAYERFKESELGTLYPRGLPTLIQYKWFFLLEQVIDGIMDLIGHAPQPFLAYLHLFPPHEPYRPHRGFVGIFDDGWIPETKAPHPLSAGLPPEALNQWRTEYDEYLAYADAEFGRLYGFLDRSGLLDSSYFVVTSDHGQLFERGVHGHVTELLYEPVLNVPLLMSGPGQEQRTDVHKPTSCVDLLPTLLQAVGQPVPEWCEGRVLATTDAEAGGSVRSLYAVEAKGNAMHRPLTQATIALIRQPYKLIQYLGYKAYRDQYELYDLENDPEERENLYQVRRSTAADLQNELEGKLRTVNRPYTEP